MAIRTISLKLDTYERLKRAKREKESFSSVVRRARFDAPESSGAVILAEAEALYDAKKGVSKKTLEYRQDMEVADAKNPRVTDRVWDEA